MTEIIRTGERGLKLTSIDDMSRFAEGVVKSGLAPESLKTSAQVIVAIQSGLEIGLAPMQALNSIVVIRGKPTLWGDASLGLVKRSGLLKEFSEGVAGEGDNMIASVVSTRNDGCTVTTTFSAADAKTAGLWGKPGPWKTHPKRMLKYKARAFNLRDNFPDVLMGMHLTEEMEGEEPLPIPQCDTPPRAERRRKVVESQDVTVTEDTQSTDTPPETAVPKTDESADGTAEFLLEDIMMSYNEKGGNNFREWAAEVLCRDEEEIESDDSFTQVMLGQLERHLETEGV